MFVVGQEYFIAEREVVKAWVWLDYESGGWDIDEEAELVGKWMEVGVGVAELLCNCVFVEWLIECLENVLNLVLMSLRCGF